LGQLDPSSRDSPSKQWTNLHNCGQPCEFSAAGGGGHSGAPSPAGGAGAAGARSALDGALAGLDSAAELESAASSEAMAEARKELAAIYQGVVVMAEDPVIR
jgi:hypothetical protein